MTREEAEELIREACAHRDLERAVELALETYGREVLGFLIARVGEQRGNEVFSDFLEDFWRGLPGFGWRSSLRGWLYVLARHALARNLRGSPSRREAALDSNAALSALVERVRTETAAHLRTPVKSRFRELRAKLSDDEQNLLILRIDRELSWRELAAVMSEQGDALSAEELDKLAVRLRQQFQRAKERLRGMAEAEGLLPPAEDET
jgi:RNA polymerase sigma-70 factor (ECF subfamily)